MFSFGNFSGSEEIALMIAARQDLFHRDVTGGILKYSPSKYRLADMQGAALLVGGFKLHKASICHRGEIGTTRTGYGL